MERGPTPVAERLQRLTDVSRAFTNARSPQEILQIAVDTAAALLRADKAVLILADDAGVFRIRAVFGVPADIGNQFSAPFDETFPMRLRDLLQTDLADGFTGVPLVVAGRIAGLLAVVRAAGQPTLPDDEWLLSAVADQTSAPVANAKLAEQLERAGLLAENARLYESEREARGRAEIALAEAERANNAKTEFLGNMNHELLTPLNAISGYVDLIEMGLRGPVTAQQLEDLGRIRSSQRRILRIVKDVLSLAKLATGTVTFSLENVRLDDVLQRLGSLIAADRLEKRIRFEYIGCDPTLTVYADREKLEDCLLNLLSNAVKYTGVGGSIRVECEAGEASTIIRVIDSGRGIPADELGRIFEPFVRIDTGLTRLTEGTGIGLSISRDIARGMGGDLTAASVDGESTTLCLSLPSQAHA